MLNAHPLSLVLTSMPGVGVRTAARILLEVGEGSVFASAGHLADYAGIAAVTHQPRSTEYTPWSGNRKLTRALPFSAFAALHDPASPRITNANEPTAESTRPSSDSPDTAATPHYVTLKNHEPLDETYRVPPIPVADALGKHDIRNRRPSRCTAVPSTPIA